MGRLSEADAKALGRLVKKYGPKVIAEEAMKVQLPLDAHRPSKGIGALKASAIEFGIQHFRERGRHDPLLTVARIVYRQEKGGRKDDTEWDTWFRTFKRQRARWRRDLEHDIDWLE
jgi:hypothetical protein